MRGDEAGTPPVAARGEGRWLTLRMADEKVPDGAALWDSETRAALKRYLNDAWLMFGVGVVAVAALVLVLVVHSSHARSAYDHGRAVDGVITSTSSCACGGATGVAYFAAGRRWSALVYMPDTSAGYYVGESIRLVYDAANPAVLRARPAALDVPHSWSRGVGLWGALALVAIFGGLAAARKARKMRLMLAGSAWRPYRFAYIPVAGRGPNFEVYAGVKLTPLQEPHAEPLLLRTSGVMFPWRLAIVAGHDGRTTWMAGDPAGQAVMGIPYPRTLVPLEQLKGSTGKRVRAAAARRQLSAATHSANAARRIHRVAQLVVVLTWLGVAAAELSQPTSFSVLLLLASTAAAAAFLYRLKRARDHLNQTPAPATEQADEPKAHAVA